MNLARLGNKFLADNEPWIIIKTDKNRVQTIMNLSLQIVANLTILMEPFLPFTSKKLATMINLNNNLKWNDATRTDLLLPGHQINPSSLLFEKVEDEIIDSQILKLNNSKIDNQSEINKSMFNNNQIRSNPTSSSIYRQRLR